MPGSISIAMIVKDEGEHLAECLASVRDLATEICVVDTGSRDNTTEIARGFGAKVSVFIWCDDFSAARNESLRLCTGDWILVIDADERIDPQGLPILRGLATGPTDCCFRLTTRNYTNTTTVADFVPCGHNDPHAHGFTGWYPSTKVRLFPSSRGAQFEGQIHELVNDSLERNRVRIRDCEVPVHHYPLLRSVQRIREKQELYLQLGHDKAASDPNDPKAYLELGNQYAEVGDYEHAAAAYRESVRLSPYNPVALRDLGGMLHLLKRHGEAKQALNLAVQLDPSLPSAWRNLGVVYADEKAWGAAVECFETGISLNPSWAEGYRYLGVALEGADRLEEASKASRKALQANPTAIECLKQFIHQMLRLEDRAAARATLLELLESGVVCPEYHNVLGELYFYDNLFEESKTHFRAAVAAGLASANNNLGVVLFREGNFSEAKTAFEQCIAVDPGHRGARNNLAKVLQHLNGS